jgi:hypothetical protein
MQSVRSIFSRPDETHHAQKRVVRRRLILARALPYESESLFEEIRGSGAPADFAWPPAGKNEYPPQASFRCHMALAVGVEAIQ